MGSKKYHEKVCIRDKVRVIGEAGDFYIFCITLHKFVYKWGKGSGLRSNLKLRRGRLLFVRRQLLYTKSSRLQRQLFEAKWSGWKKRYWLSLLMTCCFYVDFGIL